MTSHRVNPGPTTKSSSTEEEPCPGQGGQGDSNSPPTKGRSYRVVNNPFNFTGISVCDEQKQDSLNQQKKQQKSKQEYQAPPKAYAPKHAEQYNQDGGKKKRKHRKRSRSASHSPHLNRRAKANVVDNEKLVDVAAKSAPTEEQPEPSPRARYPNPVPPKTQVTKTRPPVIPAPVNVVGQKPPGPQIWKPNQIPLNAKPGPWNKQPFNPHPKPIMMPAGDGPSNTVQGTREALLEKYKKQSYNYSNDSKQYRPGKNAINESFYNKLKHMRPGELDDWYNKQYLAWNQAQVKAKVNSCLIAVPKPVAPTPEDAQKGLEGGRVEEATLGVMDSHPATVPKPSPQNNVIAAYDVTKSPVRKLIDEVSPLVKGLLQKKDRTKDTSLMQEIDDKDVEATKLSPNLNKKEAAPGKFSVNRPCKELSFYQYIRGIMMPVMMKGVPETVFIGRDKTTGSYVKDYSLDHNPCRIHLDKLLACYRNSTVSDKEMVKIRNGLAECVQGNQEFFYAKKEKKTTQTRGNES